MILQLNFISNTEISSSSSSLSPTFFSSPSPFFNLSESSQRPNSTVSSFSTRLKPSRPCNDSSQCDQTRGEFCHFLYEGCHLGQCMCDLRGSYDNLINHCQSGTKKYLNDLCDEDTDCINNLICSNSTCSCETQAAPTSDKSFCILLSIHRLIGQVCNPSLHSCLQKSNYGYTTNDVECHKRKNVCLCSNGFKQDALSCTRRKAGESGCKVPYQCEGGAMCVDGICTCPTGYSIPRGYQKCVRRGATTELGLGRVCDELNERRYCRQDLICHRCHANGPYKCVKFKNYVEYSRLTSGVGRDVFTEPLHFLIFSFIFFILTWDSENF